MNDQPIAGAGAINSLFELFVVASLLIIFWVLEAVWHNEKQRIIFVFLLPPLLIYYIFKYWEETRGRLFFGGLLVIIILLISAVTNYNFLIRIAALFQIAALWPYYLFSHYIH